MTKKIIRLTESDLTRIVQKVINEQKSHTKKIKLFPGGSVQGSLKIKDGKKILTIKYESSPSETFIVDTQLPVGNFMVELGKDGKYYGFNSKTNQKTLINIVG